MTEIRIPPDSDLLTDARDDFIHNDQYLEGILTSAAAIGYIHEQTTATDPWVINHAVDEDIIAITVLDSITLPADKILPQRVRVVSTTQVELYFGQNVSGIAYLLFGRLGVGAGDPSFFATTFSSTTQAVISHNLGSFDISVSVYDDSSPRKQFYPADITLTDSNTVTLDFSSTRSGRVVILKGAA